MANKTIVVHLSSSSGQTDLSLRLYAGATIINTGGDTLTESGTSGQFSCVVTEAVTAGWHRVDVYDDTELAYEGGWVYLPGDTEGTYLVDDPAAGGESAADVYTYFTDGTRANAFKATGFAVAGDAMTLSSGERDTLAAVIDATLLNAGDATDLIASIVTRIGNTNVDQAAFVAAVKAALFDAGSAANKLAVDASGRVTIGTNADKSGYALTATTGLGNQTANITGNISGSVGSVTSGVTVATNNDKAGYSLATAPLDATGIRTAVGLTSANLNTLITTVDTVVDAIKVKTDQLTFTVANQVDSNALTVAIDPSDQIVVAVPRLVAQSTLGGIPQLRRIDATEPGAFTFYRGTQWAMVLEDVGVLPEANEVFMTLKSGDLATVLDTAAILQIKVNLTTDAVTLVRVNGAAPESGLLDKLDMVYESYVEASLTKYKVTITLEDDITTLIVPASYSYDLKSVGDPSKLLDIGAIEVAAIVTRAI